MAEEENCLLQSLAHYRRLLAIVCDEEVQKILEEIIEETRQRLEVLQKQEGVTAHRPS